MVGFLCSMVLLSGADSTHIRLNEVEGRLKPTQLVADILSKRCPNEKIEINVSKCKNIMQHDPFTRVCYVSTEIGYFFIMRDMLDGVNVIFNRWD